MPDRLSKILTFLKQSPDDPFLLFAAAKEYEKTGDDTTALTYYERLTTDHAGYVGTYYHLGKLHERNTRPAAARATYETGLIITKRAGDLHAHGELRAALDWLELEE